MNTSAILIALGAVAGATFLFRRFFRYAPPDRGIDVGEVSTNWLAERRKDAPTEY
jgi:hypothetical protein